MSDDEGGVPFRGFIFSLYLGLSVYFGMSCIRSAELEKQELKDLRTEVETLKKAAK